MANELVALWKTGFLNVISTAVGKVFLEKAVIVMVR